MIWAFGDGSLDPGTDALHRGVDIGEGLGAWRDRQISEVDIDRETWQVANKQVDCRTALEGEAGFFGDKRKDADQQSDLLSVDFSERHAGLPERLFYRSDRGRRL